MSAKRVVLAALLVSSAVLVSTNVFAETQPPLPETELPNDRDKSVPFGATDARKGPLALTIKGILKPNTTASEERERRDYQADQQRQADERARKLAHEAQQKLEAERVRRDPIMDFKPERNLEKIRQEQRELGGIW